MDIVVCLKQVPDPSSVEVNPLTGRVTEERLVYITNPADLCALEAALRLKEEFGGKVSVINLGPFESERALKDALAMGADRVSRIWEDDWENVSAPYLVAFALSSIIKKQPCDLILCGDGGGDFQASQVPAWISEFMELPLTTGIVELSVTESVKGITVKRKLEKGKRQVMECELPAILTVTKSLNKPRECTLPNLITSLQSSIPRVNLSLGTVARMIPEVVNQEIIYQTMALAPEPQVIYTPDTSLTGVERINALISGPISRKKSEIVQGPPGEVAKRIIEFLKTNDIITRRVKGS